MNENILKQIKDIRKQKGLSLTELSKNTGISYNYLSKLEKNIDVNPTLNILTKIGKALNVEITYIIK